MVFFKGTRTKTQDTSVGIVLLEALAGEFIYFSESDVHPRVIQARRIEGTGESGESGNLPVTTPKPPVAQGAGAIYIYIYIYIYMRAWGFESRIT